MEHSVGYESCWPAQYQVQPRLGKLLARPGESGIHLPQGGARIMVERFMLHSQSGSTQAPKLHLALSLTMAVSVSLRPGAELYHKHRKLLLWTSFSPKHASYVLHTEPPSCVTWWEVLTTTFLRRLKSLNKHILA